MTIDWFSPAQCVGYAAFVLGVGSFMQKDDRRFKLFMAAECLAYIVHFALLGRPTAVASSTMSLLRSVLSLYTRSKWVAALVCGTALWIVNHVIAGSVGGTALEVMIAVVNIVTIRRMTRDTRGAAVA